MNLKFEGDLRARALAIICGLRKYTVMSNQDMTYINSQWLRDNLPRKRGTKIALARAIGVRPEIITRILSGERAIKSDEIPAICEFFGLGTLSPDQPLAAQMTERELTPAMLRLLDQLSQLDDAELDYLTVAAEGLAARRKISEASK